MKLLKLLDFRSPFWYIENMKKIPVIERYNGVLAVASKPLSAFEDESGNYVDLEQYLYNPNYKRVKKLKKVWYCFFVNIKNEKFIGKFSHHCYNQFSSIIREMSLETLSPKTWFYVSLRNFDSENESRIAVRKFNCPLKLPEYDRDITDRMFYRNIYGDEFVNLMDMDDALE